MAKPYSTMPSYLAEKDFEISLDALRTSNPDFWRANVSGIQRKALAGVEMYCGACRVSTTFVVFIDDNKPGAPLSELQARAFCSNEVLKTTVIARYARGAVGFPVQKETKEEKLMECGWQQEVELRVIVAASRLLERERATVFRCDDRNFKLWP